MVSITVDNFKDKESVAVYQLPDGSSVLDLKAEIESTEGIPIGYQRLMYLSRDLEDDENLELLIYTDDKSTIHLCQTRVYLRFVRAAVESEKTGVPYQEIGGMHLDVDLDEPIDTSLPWGTMVQFGATVKCFPMESIINLSDRSQPLSYYGICNGNAIDIVFGALEGTGLNLPRGTSSTTKKTVFEYAMTCCLDSSVVLPRVQVVRAKYNWDGKIMHPLIQGLPLKRDALLEVIPIPPSFPGPRWLYGSLLSPATSKPSFWSRLSRFSRTKNVEDYSMLKGYFPETFVSLSEPEDAKEDLKTPDDMLDVPPLPPFQFPEADRMTFNMPISDKGYSFLNITANYELLSSPIEPTHVTITLSCSTHDTRRISSVSLFIETPETEVSKAQVCKNQAHLEEIHVDKEFTESQSKQTHVDGFNLGINGVTFGFQGGRSNEHSIDITEKGSRVLRRKVDAKVHNDNTVFWSLKAPTTRLDEDGLTGEESITFILTKKPVRFKYRCQVTHSRNGVEKTMERISKA